MPRIERYICIRYQGIVHEIVNCCYGDEQAKRQAVYELERRLGKMRGGLYLTPDDLKELNEIDIEDTTKITKVLKKLKAITNAK